MQIYFAATLRGVRQPIQGTSDNTSVYKPIVDYILLLGHEFASLSPAVTGKNDRRGDYEIYYRSVSAIPKSKVAIFEVTTPSLGIGYEIGYALHVVRIPVLCLYRASTDVSAMLMGNPSCKMAPYNTDNDMRQHVKKFCDYYANQNILEGL